MRRRIFLSRPFASRNFKNASKELPSSSWGELTAEKAKCFAQRALGMSSAGSVVFSEMYSFDPYDLHLMIPEGGERVIGILVSYPQAAVPSDQTAETQANQNPATHRRLDSLRARETNSDVVRFFATGDTIGSSCGACSVLNVLGNGCKDKSLLPCELGLSSTMKCATTLCSETTIKRIIDADQSLSSSDNIHHFTAFVPSLDRRKITELDATKLQPIVWGELEDVEEVGEGRALIAGVAKVLERHLEGGDFDFAVVAVSLSTERALNQSNPAHPPQ